MAIQWSEEQKKALESTGNALVSASAGSGKTTVVVEKILRLIQEGADVRRILLVTFARAAAAEMREKLVKKMYESAKNGNQNAAKQLENLPFAHIETIDSFCAYLMKKYFNVVGCDPSVSFGEESVMKKALDESYDKAFDRLLDEGNEEFLQTADYFRSKSGYGRLKTAVFDIMKFAANRPSKEDFYRLAQEEDRKKAEEYYLQHKKILIAYVLEKLDAFLSHAASENFTELDVFYQGYRERLSSALECGDVKTFFATLQTDEKNPSKINKRFIDKGLCSQELVDQSVKTLEIIADFRKKMKSDVASYEENDNEQQLLVKRNLVKLCLETEKEFSAFKKRRKTVEIGDAIRYALKALENEQVEKDVAESFDYVFVDEYQDTNYMQEALIEKLERNNVMMVGDSKQAIFHFRLAEPAIFIAKGERFASFPESGTNLYLNTNYRSCKDILDFTNRVCDRVMIKDFCGVDYKRTARLRYGEKIKGEDRAVEVVLVPKREKEKPPVPTLYSVRDDKTIEKANDEAQFVASRVLRYVKESTFFDEEEGKDRPVRFDDIAVLVRTGKHGYAVARAFEEKNVPYYFLREEKTLFPEREVLVNAIRIAFNALDDVALYSVASSPIGSLSEKDLVLIKNTTDKNHKLSLWESLIAYKGEPKTEKRVKDFISFTEETRKKAAISSAEETLTFVLERSFDAYMLGKDVEKLAKINAFIRYVGSLPVNDSCEDFLYFYDNVFEGNKPPVKKGAVAIMTMHASKGLEFPVVVLPFQSSGEKDKSASDDVFLDGDLGLAAVGYDEATQIRSTTFLSYVVHMKKRDEERQEAARLMYVAFTRAKKFLTVVGEETNVSLSVFDSASVMQWILFAAEADEEIASRIVWAEEEERTETEGKPGDPKTLPLERLEKKYAFSADAETPCKLTVSDVLKKTEETPGSKEVFFEKSVGGENAAAKGTATHAVMQYVRYDTKTKEELAEQMDEMVRKGFLTEEERAIAPADAIFDALQSDFIQSLVGKKLLREQPFVRFIESPWSNGNKTLLQGVIDLLVREEDGLIVVDFKTGKANAETLKNRYKKQLELYADAAEKILKKKVKKKIVFAIETLTVVEI